MSGERDYIAGIDRALAVVTRLLFVGACGAGGACVAPLVSSSGGRTLIGAAAGLLAGCVALAAGGRIHDFWQRHRTPITLALLVFYVFLLGLATYSELFDLGWFRWMEM